MRAGTRAVDRGEGRQRRRSAAGRRPTARRARRRTRRTAPASATRRRRSRCAQRARARPGRARSTQPITAPANPEARTHRRGADATSAATPLPTRTPSASEQEPHLPLPPAACVLAVRAPPRRARASARISSRETPAARSTRLKPGSCSANDEPREQPQVRAHRRTDQREQRMDRLAVERIEVDRLLEKAERDHRARDVQHDGVAHVRNRDAVADAGRLEALPRQQHAQQELPIDLLRQRACARPPPAGPTPCPCRRSGRRSRRPAAPAPSPGIGTALLSGSSNSSAETFIFRDVAHSSSSARLKRY